MPIQTELFHAVTLRKYYSFTCVVGQSCNYYNGTLIYGFPDNVHLATSVSNRTNKYSMYVHANPTVQSVFSFV